MSEGYKPSEAKQSDNNERERPVHIGDDLQLKVQQALEYFDEELNGYAGDVSDSPELVRKVEEARRIKSEISQKLEELKRLGFSS